MTSRSYPCLGYCETACCELRGREREGGRKGGREREGGREGGRVYSAPSHHNSPTVDSNHTLQSYYTDQ